MVFFGMWKHHCQGSCTQRKVRGEINIAGFGELMKETSKKKTRVTVVSVGFLSMVPCRWRFDLLRFFVYGSMDKIWWDVFPIWLAPFRRLLALFQFSEARDFVSKNSWDWEVQKPETFDQMLQRMRNTWDQRLKVLEGVLVWLSSWRGSSGRRLGVAGCLLGCWFWLLCWLNQDLSRVWFIKIKSKQDH